MQQNVTRGKARSSRISTDARVEQLFQIVHGVNMKTHLGRRDRGSDTVGLVCDDGGIAAEFVLAPAALDLPAVDSSTVDVDDGLSRALVSIELDESKAPVGLKADLYNVTETLEQRDEIGLLGLRRQVADVDGRV